MPTYVYGTDADETLDRGAFGTGWVIYGGGGNDLLNTGGSNDSLYGGAGNDSLWGGTQSNVIDGGDGIDTLYWAPPRDDIGSWTLANYWNLSITTSQYNPDYYAPFGMVNTISNVENIYIYNGANNQLTGSSVANVIESGEGNDTLTGLDGNDTLIGNIGSDVLYGGIGMDFLNGGAGDDTLEGGADNDVLWGRDGNDSIIGEAGDDWADAGIGDDTLLGGAGNDYLVSGDAIYYYTPEGALIDTPPTGNNVIDGGDGDDVVLGGFGKDTLFGGSGNDEIDGYSGNDIIDGGSGNDVLRTYYGTGSSTLIGGAGNDTYLTTGTDIIIENDNAGIDEVWSHTNYVLGGNIENLILLTYWDGGVSTGNSGTGNSLDNYISGNYFVANTLDGAAGSDTLLGGVEDDTISGGHDNDEIYGDEGNDLLDGGAGNDSLYGGAGNDSLTAGSGQNIIDGGDGNDIFVFRYEGNTVVNDTSGSNLLRVERQSGVYFSQIYYNVQGGLVLEGTNGSSITISDPTNLSGIQWVPAGPEDGYSEYIIPIQNLVIGTLAGDLLTSPTTSYVEVYAADGNDQITVLSDSSWVSGDGGSDIVYGGQGDDLIHGDFRSLNTGNDTLFGGAGNDMVWGEAGRDVLDGGAGNDSLYGGLGDDVYVTDGTDTITENAAEGTDTVRSSSSYTLSANIEVLTLTGASNINGSGNSLDNLITGNSANNTLNGSTGADTLTGGLGDDIYVTDGGDTITENANEGTDTVQTSVAYTLTANLENLTLLGSAAINGTGNASNNILTGNSGNNSLTAGDGNDTLNGLTGTDTLIGGLGNDTYVTDGGDTITEAASAGTDTVQSFVTYTLGTNLENLTLTGSTAINGTGNTLNNSLVGNSANNTLNGGTGVDTLAGGAGDDTYVTDGGDTITEGVGAGTDTVQSSATLTLGSNLENLTLTGSSAINGTGNNLANTLLGNTGANTLVGGSGADTLIGNTGKDLLTGGLDSDTFVFRTMTESGTSNNSMDVISDFAQGQDKIDLSQIDAFTGGTANDIFIWRDTSAFSSATSGEVRYQQFDNTGTTNDYTLVYLDNDGDTGIESTIRLTGLYTLSATDFIL